MLLTTLLATLCFVCLVLFFENPRKPSNPKLRQFRPFDGALTSFFRQVSFVPKKPNLICHIINNVDKRGMKMMGLMNLTKVSCLHCVQWLRILHSYPFCISWLFQKALYRMAFLNSSYHVPKTLFLSFKIKPNSKLSLR